MARATPLPPAPEAKRFDLTPFRRCQNALRKRVDRGKIPGYCSAVLYRGKLLHLDAYGYADPQQGLKYGPDVLVRIYCMTKPFVAVGVLMLHERGLLSLNDPVSKYVPSFRRARLVSRSNAVLKTSSLRPKQFSILHCLTHTAGLPYGYDFNTKPDTPQTKACEELVQRVERGDIGSLEEFVDALAALPLRAQPGTYYNYSYSIDVLGRVIEVVSGMTLGRFLESQIFRPLGMKDTAFSVPKHKACRLAALYCNPSSALALGLRKSSLPRGKESLCRIDGAAPQESRWLEGRSCAVESGGGSMGTNMGGLVSSLSDCCRFFGMLSGGGELQGVRILKEATVQRYCFTDLLPECITSGKQAMAYGAPFGWTGLGNIGLPKRASDKVCEDKYNNPEVGEVAYGGAACTFWSLNPARHLATLWFTQSMDNEPFVKDVESIFIQARCVVPRTMPDPAERAVAKRRRLAGE